MDDSKRVEVVGRRLPKHLLKAIWPPKVETRPAVTAGIELRDEEDCCGDHERPHHAC